MSLAGAAGGVILGLALAFLVNMRDRSFQSEKDLSQSLGLPLVVGVPLILTPKEARAHSRRKAFEWVLGSAVTLAIVVAEFYQYYVYRNG
jgi:hypothetical protein